MLSSPREATGLLLSGLRRPQTTWGEMMALLVSVTNPLLQWDQDFIHEEMLRGSTCDLQERKREGFFLYLPLV